MWIPDKAKLIQIALHSQDSDVETPWAEDLGPDPQKPGAHLVRLASIPFLHAKPTYGDVLSVEPNDDYGRLAWDTHGLPYEQVRARIHSDEGRWMMIIDYTMSDCIDNIESAFQQLDVTAERADIAVEGAFVSEGRRQGRAYLAVPATLSVECALTIPDRAGLPLKLTLIHPVDQ